MTTKYFVRKRSLVLAICWLLVALAFVVVGVRGQEAAAETTGAAEVPPPVEGTTVDANATPETPAEGGTAEATDADASATEGTADAAAATTTDAAAATGEAVPEGVEGEGGDEDYGEDASPLSIEQLRELVDDLGSEDERLVRLDADEHTRTRQAEDGCDALPGAIAVLLDDTNASPEAAEAKALAAEYASFCIIDNPANREWFSQQQGIHEAVVKLVSSDDSNASAMASQLIYTTTFANLENHQSYLENDAIGSLADILKDHDNEDISHLQMMWAAAAIQNLAASYCETEDGRCYWYWEDEQDHVVLEPGSLPGLSDGTEARRMIMEDEELVSVLKELACTGPVSGEETADNPYPGDSAQAGRDDNSPNIVAWAAAGALKSISLEPAAATELEDIIECLCYLAQSPDWLEQEKAQSILHHMRRSDPCYMDDAKESIICIDHWFVDEEGKHCGDYLGATEEQCGTMDVTGQEKASDACCICGGGDRAEPHEEL